MANQYLALVEETTRGTTPGVGFKFLPITGKIEPDSDFKDEARVEFRGQDTRLGYLTVVRKSKSYKFDLESFLYPIDIIGILLKHVIGFAGTRAVVDATGYKGILYPPAAFPYGGGGAQVGKAIGLLPNTDLDGVTKSQIYGGARPTGFKITCKRPDDVKINFSLIGGPWIGNPGQPAVAGASFTVLSPYNSSGLTCYSGSGITRTGTAPNYTDITPNTMVAFTPDDLTISFENGIDDEDRLNGLSGPSVSVVKGSVKATVEFSIDFSDPATGFSSFDEWVAIHTAPRTMNFLFKLQGTDLAGSTTQYHQMFVDLPNMKMSGNPPDRSNDGKTPKMKFKYDSLVDATTGYPIALMIVDKVSAY